MKTPKLCSVVLCKNNVESKIGIPPIMFEFPQRSDPRFEKWCNVIERNDLLNKEVESQTYYLCINHFQPNMYFYTDTLKLHDWAIPEAIPTIMAREVEDDLSDKMNPTSTSPSPYYSTNIREQSSTSYNKKSAKENDNSNAIACCLCFSFSDCTIL